jgi:hypothetical protein
MIPLSNNYVGLDPVSEFCHNNHLTYFQKINIGVTALGIASAGGLGVIAVGAGGAGIIETVEVAAGITALLITAGRIAVFGGALIERNAAARTALAAIEAGALIGTGTLIGAAIGAAGKGLGFIAGTGAAVLLTAVAGEARIRQWSKLDAQPSDKAFFSAILHNDLNPLPPDSEARASRLSDYQSIMPEGMERICRAIIEQLIESPSDLTGWNVPGFLHVLLPEIRELQIFYRSLKNKNGFSLMEEPIAALPQEMLRLILSGRELAGRLSTEFAPKMDWKSISECADRLGIIDS